MDARAKSTLYRLLALFLAAGAGDAVIQFVTAETYDWRHLIGGLVVAAVMAGEQFLKQTDSTTASPSVKAVDAALQDQAALGGSIAASVAPPKVAVPPAH